MVYINECRHTWMRWNVAEEQKNLRQIVFVRARLLLAVIWMFLFSPMKSICLSVRAPKGISSVVCAHTCVYHFDYVCQCVCPCGRWCVFVFDESPQTQQPAALADDSVLSSRSLQHCQQSFLSLASSSPRLAEPHNCIHTRVSPNAAPQRGWHDWSHTNTYGAAMNNAIFTHIVI